MREFHAADLAADQRGAAVVRDGFDKLLLDPPRSGADAVLEAPAAEGARAHRLRQLPSGIAGARRGHLVNERGFKLRAAGVMDMFPHTAHVESIALFERAPEHAAIERSNANSSSSQRCLAHARDVAKSCRWRRATSMTCATCDSRRDDARRCACASPATQAFLNIKSRDARAYARSEFDYRDPVADAGALLRRCASAA